MAENIFWAKKEQIRFIQTIPITHNLWTSINKKKCKYLRGPLFIILCSTQETSVEADPPGKMLQIQIPEIYNVCHFFLPLALKLAQQYLQNYFIIIYIFPMLHLLGKKKRKQILIYFELKGFGDICVCVLLGILNNNIQTIIRCLHVRTNLKDETLDCHRFSIFSTNHVCRGFLQI